VDVLYATELYGEDYKEYLKGSSWRWYIQGQGWGELSEEDDSKHNHRTHGQGV
jgi:hypothetical protein